MMKPSISLIVAMDPARVIGKDGGMPWRLPADLRWFKKRTLGKPVIMGRKTFASIGRALPGRKNIVVTKDPYFTHEGVIVARDPETAIELAATDPFAPEVMIIGGATIYDVFLPRADRLYRTTVHGRFSGDTFFPPIIDVEWRTAYAEHQPADPDNPYAMTFEILERTPRA